MEAKIKPADSKYAITVMKEEQIPEAMALCAKVFVEDEVQTMWLKMSYDYTYKLLVDYQMKSLNPMLTLIATDTETNKIVGVVQNLDFSWEIEEVKGDPMDCILIEIENRYRKTMLKTPGFNKDEKAIIVYALSVDDTAKGKGLGKELCWKSFEYAKKLGYKRVIANTTNIFSVNLVKESMMRKVEEIINDDYEWKDPKTGLITKPWKGVDEWFTAIINKKIGPKKKPFTSTAKSVQMFVLDLENLNPSKH